MKSKSAPWLAGLLGLATILFSIGPGCSKPLSTEEKASLHLTDAEFDAKIHQNDKPVLIDFTASWCPPCRYMDPILAELEEQRSDLITIVKVDIDANPHLAERFQITGVPTFYIYRDGKALAAQSGARGKEDFVAWIEATLSAADS